MSLLLHHIILRLLVASLYGEGLTLFVVGVGVLGCLLNQNTQKTFEFDKATRRSTDIETATAADDFEEQRDQSAPLSASTSALTLTHVVLSFCPYAPHAL